VKKLPVLVLLGAALLFLWWLGGHDLWAPDEPYFAEGAREMVVDGQWAVPHVNGVVTTDKPPLVFWLIALFSLPFGTVTLWTARLPSALAGLATVALTMRLGHRMFGPRTAALAGVALTTTFLFWHKARWSQTDAVLCLLIWVALSAFEGYRAGDVSGRRAGLLFWLAAGLAILDKGPVGLMLPLGIVLVTLAVDRQLGRWWKFAPLSGPLLFAAVVGAWIVLATVGGHGEYSVWGSLQEHFVNRGLHGMHHRQPPWYYLKTLPVSLWPWIGLIPGALVLAWRRRLRADRLLLVAALFPVVFFSISTEKRELYVLPSMPAFALLAAALVAAFCRWNEPASAEPTASPVGVHRRWLTVGQGIVAGLMVAIAAGLLAAPLFADKLSEVPVSSTVLALLALAFGAAGIGTFYCLARGRTLGAVLAPAAGSALAYLLVVTLVYPVLDAEKSARTFSVSLREQTADSRAQGLPVLSYDLSNLPEAFAYYTDGLYTQETWDPAAVIAHLQRPEQVYAVVNGTLMEHLPEAVRQQLSIVATASLSRREVLLITNRRSLEPLAPSLPPSPQAAVTPPASDG
jgi:4-amino-4-deoxy-L-arabinose transferase-like glycosyltransferase